MLQFYFLRHGQTEFNLKRIVQGGGIDSDLNETGHQQALKFFEHYADTGFDAVVCSKLKRTYQTIAPFDQNLNLPLIKLEELNELSWGVMEGQQSTPDMHAEFLALNKAWESGNLEARIDGGESPLEVWHRSARGIEKLQSEFPSGKLLVCTHGRTLRIILSEMLGYGMAKMNLFPHENTCLNIVNVPKSGKPYAERLNDLRHLN